MDISIFTDKTQKPTTKDLVRTLKTTFTLWEDMRDFILGEYPGGVEDWNYPGKNYGWSFRIKDKKRAIAYFLPREGYFKMAFVFGGKAMEQVLTSEVDEKIKTDLQQARVYAEGRGVQIVVKDETPLSDIKKLVSIKLAN